MSRTLVVSDVHGHAALACIDVGGKRGRRACAAWLYDDCRPPEFVLAEV